MNIAHWLRNAARSRANEPAVALAERTVLTYGQLGHRAAGLADGLRSTLGLKAGERVAIVARNHPAYIEVLFGAWWAGLVVVPVNSKLHSAEVAWIVKHSGARVVFASADVETGLGGQDLDDVVEVSVLGTDAYEQLICDPAPIATRAIDDLAWLFYTSGTTGRPKGAMLTHGNLVAMGLAHLVDLDPTVPGDVLVHSAPLSHGSGLLALPHVARMGQNVIPESGGFETSETLALAHRWRRTSMFAAPTMVRRLVEAPEDVDRSAIRTIVWGGAPMHVADTIRGLDRLGPCLAQLYGQGETPMTITALAKEIVGDRDHPRWLERLASAGTVRPVVELDVAGEDGRSCEPGDLGEVLVRGSTVMAGYWNDQAASDAALRDGWLHTGDVGVLDAEGYLTLMDRSKDLVISGGSNIYPREVEEVLATHPAVAEVAVIGRPDPEWGEVVVAYVAGDAEPEDLDELCLGRIARFKRPKHYVRVDSLPTNNYGKVLKTELRALDARAQQAADAVGNGA